MNENINKTVLISSEYQSTGQKYVYNVQSDLELSNRKFESLFVATSEIVSFYNVSGFIVKSIASSWDAKLQAYSTIIIFEKANAERDRILTELINETASRIDEKSKKYVESAKLEIESKVLTWLGNIPQDVMSKEFKENLQNQLMLEVDEKIRNAIEACKNMLKGN